MSMYPILFYSMVYYCWLFHIWYSWCLTFSCFCSVILVYYKQINDWNYLEAKVVCCCAGCCWCVYFDHFDYFDGHNHCRCRTVRLWNTVYNSSIGHCRIKLPFLISSTSAASLTLRRLRKASSLWRQDWAHSQVPGHSQSASRALRWTTSWLATAGTDLTSKTTRSPIAYLQLKKATNFSY